MDLWVRRRRRVMLIMFDVFVGWASIFAFIVMLYLDVPGGVPSALTLTAIVIAVGIHPTVGAIRSIFDGRYEGGTKREASWQLQPQD